ncbi:hypothetical protein F4678DRAFT_447322 [Xylaria arbuscula]|nr:hypothetical protein F4678DRAFT_447322 [Xylaria arbuscula]
MPRKVRIPADPAQNRENQQRSRARRREYIADLEARVRHFETRDMAATLEMQHAAREVAWGNARLLEMLAARGVERGEVDAYLARCKERERICAAASGGGGGGGAARGVGLEEEELGYCQGSTDLAKTGTSSHKSTDSEGGGNEKDVTSDRPERSAASVNVDDSEQRALITSCDAAAGIIAGFQGHGDVSRAREALGCDDVAHCHVKNTRLFQLMDETGCS